MEMIICEKQNVAQRISGILSGGKHKTGTLKGVNYYTFDETVVIGLRGHIITMDYPKELNRWSYRKLEDMITAEPVKEISEEATGAVIKKFIEKTSLIIIATDFDREGELIGVETLNYIISQGWKGDVKRARFSSLSPEEIKTSFKSLAEVDYNLADSGEARQEIDLVWGAVLTRYTSLVSNRSGKDFISIGRVQTPTLSLIVNKEREIVNFIPEKYYEISSVLRKGSESFNAAHKKNPFKSSKDADAVYSRIKKEKSAVISSVKKRDVVEKKPAPFDTTSFIQESTRLGFTAARVMNIAEELYTSGWISYPRTDNTVYPSGMDFREIANKFVSGQFQEFANIILGKKKLSPSKGTVLSTDHPPIYPVEYAPPGTLSNESQKIYDMIVKRFFATLMDDAKRESTTCLIDLAGESFEAYGIKTIEPGWRLAYTYTARGDVYLPELSEGESVSIDKIRLEDKETKPPVRYSQGKIIVEMAKLGLGTKATRHDIIQKLYSRGFVNGKSPAPTILGDALIFAFEKYATSVTSSDMTSRLENDMDKIAGGGLKKSAVTQESREMLTDILSQLKKNEKEVSSILKDAIKKQNTIGVCNKCQGDLLILRSKRGSRFVGCSGYPECKNTYSLPPHGKIVSTMEVCEECGSPVVKLIGKAAIMVCINMKCNNKKFKQSSSKKGRQEEE